MSEQVVQGLVLITHILEIAGASFLVLGFVIDTAQWLRRVGQQRPLVALDRYRRELGRSVLFGLEILVAATIIKTITIDPSLESMGLLAATVIVRTMLGWTTALEISGRWPWQRR